MVNCSGSSAVTPPGAQMAAVFSPVSSLHLLPGALVLALQTSSSMTRKLVQLSLTQEARESPREDTDWPVWVTCPPLKSSLRPAPDGHLWLSPLIYGSPRSTTHVRLFSSPARFLSQVLSQPLQVSLLPTYFVQLFSLCWSFCPLHPALHSNQPRLRSQSTGSAPLCPSLPIFTLQILPGQFIYHLLQEAFPNTHLELSLHRGLIPPSVPPPSSEVLHLKNTATYLPGFQRSEQSSFPWNGPGLILNVGILLGLYFSLILKRSYRKHKSKKKLKTLLIPLDKGNYYENFVYTVALYLCVELYSCF